MRPIPLKLKEQMSCDPFMKRCIHADAGRFAECDGRIEWEHAHVYKGRQINEKWAIVPVCERHHRGGGLNKEFNRYCALKRADMDDICERMPRYDWRLEFKYLERKYGV